MKRVLLLIALGASAPAQELVMNYLGGAALPAIGFSALVQNRAAIGVSPNGRYLWVTQAASGSVLRYDLQARTVASIQVSSLTETVVVSQSAIAGIAVADDGSALVPVGGRIARLDAEGRVTNPGIPFSPQNGATLPVTVRAVAYSIDGAARNNLSLVMGEQTGSFRVWTVSANITNLNGGLGNCGNPPCDNSGLAAGSPDRNYRIRQIGGMAARQVANPNGSVSYAVHFTDPDNQVPSVSGSGLVAIFQSGNVTILGHTSSTAIPVGSSGARLNRPAGIALDTAGNLYVADSGNHRILRRSAAGAWSVYAGSGARGSRGDGGPALQAEFFEPRSIALDSAGVLYVHDSGNGLLRRILPSGTVESINGGASETLVRDVQFPNVSAIASDPAGRILIAAQNRIVRVETDGRVNHVAGTGQALLGPDGMRAVDSPIASVSGLAAMPNGDVVWSDRFRIRGVGASGIVSTVAGTGAGLEPGEIDPDPVAARSARLTPGPLAVTPDGSLVIGAPDHLRRLRDGVVTSITVPWSRGYASGIPAIFTSSGHNTSILALPDGRLVFDVNNTIRQIDPEGFVSTWADVPNTRIQGLAVGPAGSLYALLDRPGIPNTSNSTVLARVSRTGEVTRLSADLRVAGAPVLRPGQPVDAWQAYGSAIGGDGRGFLYFADVISRRILVIGEPSTVTVDSDPSGQSILVDGARVTTPQTLRWLPGDYHTVQAPEQADGRTFAGWNHGAGQTVTWMPPGGASTVTARFE